jgi:hypothetical protein
VSGTQTFESTHELVSDWPRPMLKVLSAFFEFPCIFCLEFELLIFESEQLGTSGWL